MLSTLCSVRNYHLKWQTMRLTLRISNFKFPVFSTFRNFFYNCSFIDEPLTQPWRNSKRIKLNYRINCTCFLLSPKYSPCTILPHRKPLKLLQCIAIKSNLLFGRTRTPVPVTNTLTLMRLRPAANDPLGPLRCSKAQISWRPLAH